MADPLKEARLQGSIDQHEQITIVNAERFDPNAQLAPNEVFAITNASGNVIPHVSRATTSSASSGEAHIIGEFIFAKRSTSVFAADDDIYWAVGHNVAVTRAEAKAGDFYVARCTLAASASVEHVRGRLGQDLEAAEHPSVSSSESVSTSSSSSESDSTSVSSTSDSSTSSTSTSSTSSSYSKATKSISSLSDSSSSLASFSSESDSSSSTSNSISSNSDSSASSSSTSIT